LQGSRQQQQQQQQQTPILISVNHNEQQQPQQQPQQQLRTSQVTKYPLGKQVQNMSDASLNGWYVVAIQATSGNSGPGTVTLSPTPIAGVNSDEI
jgi:hypothetical protein